MTTTTRKSIWISVGVAVFMFGFSFAIAPLYNAYCKVTGINITTRIMGLPDLNRDIFIQFTTSNNHGLTWEFYPKTLNIHVHPNENTKVIFFAKNTTNKTMTVQAIPSFTPSLVAQHFHKAECFCFKQQTLKAGESINMPVVFHVDEDLPREMNTFTLSYTLFNSIPKNTKES
jgi:cytochrome c oxidase assembly protein subunit 11